MEQQLTLEDKQRIEKYAIEKYGIPPYTDEELIACCNGAEYATIYERQKLDGDSLAQHQIDYYENKLELMHRVAAEQHKDFEAERSELVKLIGDFWESYRQFNAIPDELENRILNSLKTK